MGFMVFSGAINILVYEKINGLLQNGEEKKWQDDNKYPDPHILSLPL